MRSGTALWCNLSKRRHNVQHPTGLSLQQRHRRYPGLYVASFSSYDKTYGALGGVIAFLLWLWLTNVALLFGAELDAELERGRELQAGIPAEETIQLPPRDSRQLKKAEKKRRKDIEKGRAIRLQHGAGDEDDR